MHERKDQPGNRDSLNSVGKDFQITVTDANRKREFQEIFGSDTVCVLAPIPEQASGPMGRCLIYQLDLGALTAEQRAHLVRHICARFNTTPEEAELELKHRGMPILAEHTMLTVLNPGRWLS
jgi:hypothetical protein